ncbi:DUF1249 domain-containing protein [Marinicella sp. W31]|uniref:DUF1249 domain-containing protein n=1 Tax=Marinicella sp. W31 TaxID=3023713 RepID=UPI0037580A30
MLFDRDMDEKIMLPKAAKPNLMGMQEACYRMLELLLPKQYEASCEYTSLLKKHPKLKLSIDAKHAYTSDLSLEYQFENHCSDRISIRMYHDAELAELLHATELERQLRLQGPMISTLTHARLRSKQSIFLHKWLIYLLDTGYGVCRWELHLD